jgi:cytochrome c peroxidase
MFAGVLSLLLQAVYGERPVPKSHIAEFREWMRARPRSAPKATSESAEQALGAALYADENLSLNRNQSCASCHSLEPATDPVSGRPLPTPGFVDPTNLIPGFYVSRGSEPGKSGALNAPSVGYAAFSPRFAWNKTKGMYEGGQFWNGRAATLQAQAGLPMLNPLEMAMPSKWGIVTRLKRSVAYRDIFQRIYKLDLAAVPDNENAPRISSRRDSSTKHSTPRPAHSRSLRRAPCSTGSPPSSTITSPVWWN